MESVKKAYKLVRKMKNGNITSLFINKSEPLDVGIWLQAKNYPTKGYKIRPYWHCTEKPHVPHLTEKNREWWVVEIKDYQEFKRPKYQGSRWFLAKYIKLIERIE